MRIASANIPVHTGKLLPNSQPVAAATAGQRRLQAAAETYNKNTQAAAVAQVIDAEYVEFYPASTAVLNQERHQLDNTLETAAALDAAAARTGSRLAKSIETYQSSAQQKREPSGLLLDIYA